MKSSILFKLILVLAFIMTSFSCSQKGVNPNDINHFGITMTNPVGDEMSYDPDDWKCSEQIYPRDTSGVILLPNQFCFGPAYPNPFNGGVSVSFALPIATHVKISIYKMNSNSFTEQKVTDLINSYFEAGVQNAYWDASDMDDGIYRFVLETDNFTSYGDVLLINPESNEY